MKLGNSVETFAGVACCHPSLFGEEKEIALALKVNAPPEPSRLDCFPSLSYFLRGGDSTHPPADYPGPSKPSTLDPEPEFLDPET